MNKGQEYAILTDEITKAWSGFSVKEYKKYKDLKKINETNDIVFFLSNAGFKTYFEKKNASNKDIERLHAFFDKQNIPWRKSIL